MKSRFNKRTILVLPLLVLSLASCSEEVSELYGPSPYDTTSFVKNYFVGRDDFSGKHGASSATSLSSSNMFAGLNDSVAWDGFTNARAKYPSMFVDKNGNKLSMNYENVYSDWNAQNADDTNYIGVAFGRTLCLDRIDDSFKRGALSKLYDGQLHCNGAYSKARTQLTSDGYSAFFPKTMDTADYFVVSGRWADDSLGLNSSVNVKADIKVSFYKANGSVYDSKDITMAAIPFERNNGGSNTTLFGFKFSDALPDYSLSGVVGMGISFSNVVDTYFTADQVTYTNEEKDGIVHSAFMLYEVMLINSTWH